MDSNSITLRGLTLMWGPKKIVSGLDFTLPGGKIGVLSGMSGAGKTTLLKSVLGFIPPYEGEILIGDKPLDDHTVWMLRQRMAFVPQEPDLGDGTVEEILKRPFSYRATQGLTWDKGKVRDTFTALGLEHELFELDVKKLSGGERQRIAFAGALMLKRDLLLLDEPTSALDAARKASVIELVKSLKGTTVLMAAHDERLVAAADVVLDMEKNSRSLPQ